MAPVESFGSPAIWFILMLIGLLALAGLAVVVAIVVAISKKRPGIALSIGGIALVAVFMLPVLLWFVTAAPAVHSVSISAPGINTYPHDMNSSMRFEGHYTSGGPKTTWRISFFPALVIAAVVAVLLASAFRHSNTEISTAHRRRWWPALLLIPLLLAPVFLVLMFFGVRRSEELHSNAHVAEAQIAHMDIHQLLDKADAPRIELAEQASHSPQEPNSPSSEANDPPANHDARSNDEVGQLDNAAESREASVTSEGNDGEDVPLDKQHASSASDQAGPSVGANESTTGNLAPKASEGDRSAADAGEVSSSDNKRPSWVNDPPKRVGQTWREVLETEEFVTADEAYKAADSQLLLATYNHLRRLTGESLRPFTERLSSADSPPAGFTLFSSFGIGIDYIRREIAQDEYMETVERSFGPMKKLYTLIEFTPAVDRELLAKWNSYRRQERFAAVGLGAGAVLGLLALAWGLLKMDTWTRGYYTKRLFLGVPGAIIIGIISFLIWNEVIF